MAEGYKGGTPVTKGARSKSLGTKHRIPSRRSGCGSQNTHRMKHVMIGSVPVLALIPCLGSYRSFDVLRSQWKWWGETGTRVPLILVYRHSHQTRSMSLLRFHILLSEASSIFSGLTTSTEPQRGKVSTYERFPTLL